MKLGDLCVIKNGYAFKSGEFKNSGVPVVKITNIHNNKVSFDEDSSFIDANDFKKYEDFVIKKDDILIALSGATTGKYGIYDSNHAALLNQRVAAIRPKSGGYKLTSKYLFYYMSRLQGRILQKAGGAAQPNVSTRDISEFDIPVPSVQEQDRIAASLETADKLIQNRKEAMAKLDELSLSLFVDMFGNPITNPKGWPTTVLENVVILQRGFDLPASMRNDNGDIEVWGSNGVVGCHDEYKIKGGGVITGRSGSIGNVYYTFHDFWALNTTLYSKETYGNDIVFLTYLLKMFKLDRFFNGTGVPTLNRNIIHRENIYTIPVQLQKKFSKLVLEIESQKQNMQKQLSILEQNFQALLHRAFAGQLQFRE